MTLRFTKDRWRSAFLLAALLILGSSLQEAQAQFVFKWLAVGDMHAYYTEAGSHNESYNGHNVEWPGIRQNVGNVRGYAMWIGARDFTDENGETWNHKIAHVGPRITGLGEVFPTGFQMVSQFEPPGTFVDGFETIYRPVFNDAVESSLPADRAIENSLNTVIGLQMERTVYAWSQEYHDDYHITEYTFTNTGNTDDDDEIELEGQTLENVYIHFQNRYATNSGAGRLQTNQQAWGRFQMNDAVGDEHEDYDVDFRAQYSWLGNVPKDDYETTIGGPVWNDNHWAIAGGDSIGRLGAPNFIGKVYIHADAQAYPEGTPISARTDGTELPYSQSGAQPATMGKLWTGDERTHVNDHRNEALMASEWDLITMGREYPHHADLVLASNGQKASKADFRDHSGDPTLGQGSDGFAFVESFGPYTIPFGETVKLVIAEGVASISDEAAVEIGRAYRQAGGSDNAEIEFDADGDGVIEDDERMNKNLWVMTSRDSLFQLFERAIANFENGYNIPEPPRPPASFSVTSGVDQIEIEWTPMESPEGGWELWRAEGRYDGLPVKDEFIYKKIATLDAGTDELPGLRGLARPELLLLPPSRWAGERGRYRDDADGDPAQEQPLLRADLRAGHAQAWPGCDARSGARGAEPVQPRGRAGNPLQHARPARLPRHPRQQHHPRLYRDGRAGQDDPAPRRERRRVLGHADRIAAARQLRHLHRRHHGRGRRRDHLPQVRHHSLSRARPNRTNRVVALAPRVRLDGRARGAAPAP